ncbi:retrotransposon protein, putative, ty1-copia subclass [Tanacetum coccineum]
MEKYKRMEEVGCGTFGVVYKAIDKETGEVVAVKKLKMMYDSWEECMNLPEVKAIKKMKNHPNIVEVKEIIKHKDYLYMVFEYMECSLNQAMAQQEKPFSKTAIRGIILLILGDFAWCYTHAYIEDGVTFIAKRFIGIASVVIIDRQLPFEYTITSRSTDVVVMALPVQNINHSAFRSMFEREKLSGNNFNDWFRQLKLVLRVEKKMYVIEQPLPAAPAADSEAQVLSQWDAVYDAYNEVACLILSSMTPELHRQFENSLPYDMIKELKAMFEKQAEVESGEYISQEFKDYLKACGIVQQLTPPYTPQHNRVSERRNRTLLDMVRSMMNLTTLSLSFWDYALESATRILNMVPTKKVDKTPYELWYGKVPNMSYLKV